LRGKRGEEQKKVAKDEDIGIVDVVGVTKL
jgi:hypothetical protein